MIEKKTSELAARAEEPARSGRARSINAASLDRLVERFAQLMRGRASRDRNALSTRT